MWLFAAVVLVLAVFVPGFRKLVLIVAAIAVLVLAAGLVVTAIQSNHGSEQVRP